MFRIRRPHALRALTAVPLVLALSALAVPSASAQQLRFQDARHDVVSVDVFGDGTPKVDPGLKEGDISSVFIHYRTGRLVVRANFVRLDRAKHTLIDYGGLIRTNTGRRWLFNVVTSPGHYEGHDQLIAFRGRSSCEIGHMFVYRDDFARASIPLRCLDNPRWVQMQLGAASISFKPNALRRGHLEPGSFMLHFDEAQDKNSDHMGWTPRVHR